MTRYLSLKLSLIFIIKLVAVVVFLHISPAGFSQCDITNLGPSDENQASYGYAESLSSVNFQNKTYICYRDKLARIMVRQWDGSVWSTVGDGPVSSTLTRDAHIAISSNGTPYMIYKEISNSAHVSVRKWDGNNWVAVGGDWLIDEYWPINGNMTNRLAIGIDPDDNIYVAFADMHFGEKTTVMKWNGTQWIIVGSRGISAGFMTSVNIAFDNAGTLHVGFVRAFEGSFAGEVMKFDGTNWISLGAEPVSAFDEFSIYLTNDKAGNIYFAHKVTEPDWAIHVKKLVNGAWTAVGGNVFNGFSDLLSLSFDNSGIPYVAINDRSLRGTAVVKKLQSDSWVTITPGSTMPSRAAITAINFFDDGRMRFAYSELPGEVVVLEGDGASWTELGLGGLSEGSAGSHSVAIDGKGTPYILYEDLTNNIRAVVKKWTGTAWVQAGDAIIEANNQIFSPNIVFDERETMYIAFSDYLHGSKTVVKKLVDNQWLNVGNPYFSNGEAISVHLTIGQDGNPYITYSDKSIDNKAIVKKWNESTWETVGPEGISDQAAESTKIAIDKNGAPVLVYLDKANGGKMTVKKWNGTNWVNLGAGTISPNFASQTAIVTDKAGFVYVAHKNYALEGELVVQKWDGTQWIALGNSNISEGAASSVSLNVASDGGLFITYADAALDNRVIIKKWDGSAWNQVGEEPISFGYVNSVSMAIDISGTQVVVYGSGDIYAKAGKSSLANSEQTQTIEVGESSGLFNENCELMVRVTPNGDNPAGGAVTAKVWVESAQPKDFVGRHYEITPANAPSESTGKVTLYFSQNDFDAFNKVSAVKLPVNATDQQGIANLLIEKRGGTSSNQTGLPDSYTGNPLNINPKDSDILWNTVAQHWEVSFDVIGFSGFFVKTSESALPVQLTTFNSSQFEGKILLTWETTSEFAASHFEIERSKDAKHFQMIGNVKSTGHSKTAQSYSFLDDHFIGFKGTAYYRLRIVDLDGTFSYSNTISSKIAENGETILVFPNPVANGSQISIEGKSAIKNVVLFDPAGRPISLPSVERTDNEIKFPLSHFPSGSYLLKIETNDDITTKTILIK